MRLMLNLLVIGCAAITASLVFTIRSGDDSFAWAGVILGTVLVLVGGIGYLAGQLARRRPR